jgi:gamma-glutamyltranspeptidase/glutathione hydrolase
MESSDLQFNSRRSPVFAKNGMVATSQPLAVQAGLQILSIGGNAADAAVAVAAALAVTEPTSTGIGGDCFALFYDSHSGIVTALNGSGRAPGNLSLELLADQGFSDELPWFHAHTITVPGACAGWCDLVNSHGQLNLEDVLAPAIQLAEDGFPVSPITAYFWAKGVENQLSKTANGHELTLEGRAPNPGEVFQNPNMARTLQKVTEGGARAFYEGEIAEAILAAVQSAGGVMDEQDLANHHSTWDDPISTTYRDLRIWECPPNGQGLTALLALNILEGFDIPNLPPLGPERLHLIIEALRIAFADTRWYVADPAFTPPPLDGLLSKSYAEERRRILQPGKAAVDLQHGSPSVGSDTVYLTVVDKLGNACSFINSNYQGFGTGIVPAGWGFSLQNRGHNFSLDPDHPNALAPGKRPYHTIIPALATRSDGSLYASFGVMGGFMQPQGHVQVILGLVDDGLDPQSTLDRPRICIQGGTPEDEIGLEYGISEETMAQLAAWGHPVELVTGMARALFGRGQIILREPSTAVLCAGSDPRSDGCAAGLP